MVASGIRVDQLGHDGRFPKISPQISPWTKSVVFVHQKPMKNELPVSIFNQLAS